MMCIIKELNSVEVFSNVTGRKHRSFSNFKNNPVLSLKKKDVDTWLKVQWTILLAGLILLVYYHY